MSAVLFPPPQLAIIRSAEGMTRPQIQSTLQVDAASLGAVVGQPPPLVPPDSFLRQGMELQASFSPAKAAYRMMANAIPFLHLTRGTATIDRADATELRFHGRFKGDVAPTFSLSVNAQGKFILDSVTPTNITEIFAKKSDHLHTEVQPQPSSDPHTRVFLAPAYDEVDEEDYQRKQAEWEDQKQRAKTPGQPRAAAAPQPALKRHVEASQVTITYLPKQVSVSFRGNVITMDCPKTK